MFLSSSISFIPILYPKKYFRIFLLLLQLGSYVAFRKAVLLMEKKTKQYQMWGKIYNKWRIKLPKEANCNMGLSKWSWRKGEIV